MHLEQALNLICLWQNVHHTFLACTALYLFKEKINSYSIIQSIVSNLNSVFKNACSSRNWGLENVGKLCSDAKDNFLVYGKCTNIENLKMQC